MGITAAVGILATTSVASTVVSAKGQSKQRKGQERIRDAENRQNRINQARESRIQRSQIQQAAVNSGAGLDSSSVIQGQQNVASQVRTNELFVNQISDAQAQIASGQNLKMIGQSIGQVAVSYTHLTLPTIYSV